VNRGRGLLAGLIRDFPQNPLYRQELARLAPEIQRGTQ
jgi:hypothetical protein